MSKDDGQHISKNGKIGSDKWSSINNTLTTKDHETYMSLNSVLSHFGCTKFLYGFQIIHIEKQN